MGFEKRVLDVVDVVIPAGQYAGFTNGTLFVECTAKEAAKLETALTETFDFGLIVSVSSIEGEFAFDFV